LIAMNPPAVRIPAPWRKPPAKKLLR